MLKPSRSLFVLGVLVLSQVAPGSCLGNQQEAETQTSPAEGQDETQQPADQQALAVKEHRWIESYQDALLAARLQSKPVLVIGGAPWCNWCEKLLAELQGEVANRLAQRWVLCHFNVDQDVATAEVLEANALPAIRVLSPSGKVIAGREGYLPVDALLTWLDQHWEQARATLPGLLEDPASKVSKENLPAWFMLLGAKQAEVREAAIARIVQVPEVSAEGVVGLISDERLIKRLSAMEILRRWQMPTDVLAELDPWLPETLTPMAMEQLQNWRAERWPVGKAAEPGAAAGILADVLALTEESFADQQMLADGGELSDVERADIAERLSALIVANLAEREVIFRDLVRYGERLLPLIKQELAAEPTEEIRRQLDRLRYHCAASESLRLTHAGPLQLLAEGDGKQRFAAAEMLLAAAKFGDRALLAEMLSDQDVTLRELAVEGLVRIAPNTSSDLLTKLLKDPDANLRAAVLKRLAEAETEAAKQAVIDYLATESDVDLILYAVRYLRTQAAPEVNAEMIRLCEHPAWQVRAAAIETLTEDFDSYKYQATAVPAKIANAILQRCNDDDPFVAGKARKHLDSLVREDNLAEILQVVGSNSRELEQVLKGVSKLSRGGERANQFFVQAMEAGEPTGQQQALLGWLFVNPPEQSVRELPTWIQSGNPQTSELAMRLALSLLRNQQARIIGALPPYPAEITSAANLPRGESNLPADDSDQNAEAKEATEVEEPLFDFETVEVAEIVGDAEPSSDSVVTDAIVEVEQAAADDVDDFFADVIVPDSVAETGAALPAGENENSRRYRGYLFPTAKGFTGTKLEWVSAWSAGQHEDELGDWRAEILSAAVNMRSGGNSQQRFWSQLLILALEKPVDEGVTRLFDYYQELDQALLQFEDSDSNISEQRQDVARAIVDSLSYLRGTQRARLMQQLRSSDTAAADKLPQVLLAIAKVPEPDTVATILELLRDETISLQPLAAVEALLYAVGKESSDASDRRQSLGFLQRGSSGHAVPALPDSILQQLVAAVRIGEGLVAEASLATLLNVVPGKALTLVSDLVGAEDRPVELRVVAAMGLLIYATDQVATLRTLVEAEEAEIVRLGLQAALLPESLYELMPEWLLPAGDNYWYPDYDFDPLVMQNFDLSRWTGHEDPQVAALAVAWVLVCGQAPDSLSRDALDRYWETRSGQPALGLLMARVIAKQDRSEQSGVDLAILRDVEQTLDGEMYALTRLYLYLRPMNSEWAVGYRKQLRERYGSEITVSF